MFTINGPSGPTSRHERRVVTDVERTQREEARKQQVKQKGESFFHVRKTRASPKAAAIASEGSKHLLVSAAATSAREAVNGGCIVASSLCVCCWLFQYIAM